MLYVFAKIFIAPLVWLFLRPKVYGRENLNIQGKAIICCNHRAAFDPVLLAIISPRFIHFMAKKELFDIPVLGWLITKVGAFPVDRQISDINAVKTAMQILKSGDKLLIFPEGTVIRNGVG